MSVLLVASAVRTCLGDGARTFAALCRGETGVGPLRYPEADALNVAYGYHLDDFPRQGFAPTRWLEGCVRRAVADAGLDASRRRVVAVVGTGLRELAEVEARSHYVHDIHG